MNLFCDGDFWHGRRLTARLEKLTRGHNAPYWVAKITANVARDRRTARTLRAAGWTVLRFWESDVVRDADKVAQRIAIRLAVRSRDGHRRKRRK